MISYPLTPPAGLGPSHVKFTDVDVVGANESPFDGSQEIQQWPGQWFELEVALPPMIRRTVLAGQWLGFLGALHGKVGTFTMGDPLGTGPMGSALGSPVAASSLTLANAIGQRVSGVVTLAFPLPLPPGIAAGTPLTLAAVPFDSSFNGSFTVATLYPAWSGNTAYWAISYAQAGADSYVGEGGSATFPPPLALNPSRASQLYTSAWIPNQNGVLLRGDYLQVQPAGAPARLHKVLTDVNSDGGGNAAIDIFPTVRETIPAGTPLILTNPVGTFRLAQNRRDWDTEKNKTVAISFKAREAI